MRSAVLPAFACLLSVCFATAPAQGRRVGNPLANAVGDYVRQAEKLGARCGVDIRALGEAGLRYQHRSREAFTPASNMKILSAAHVARVLGLDYEFVTRFDVGGPPQRAVLRVRASGDPTLSQLRLGSRNPFAGLAAALRREGVQKVARIELLAPRWVGPARPATWPQGQLHKSYAAPTGAFVLEEACCVVALTPREHGKAARVEVYPRGAQFELRGRVMSTRSQSQGRRPIVSPSSDGARLSGSIWTGFETSYTRFADRDPELRYRSALREHLRAAQIASPPVGASKAVEAAASREESDALRACFELRSPIEWALRRLLEDSSNFQAEQLLRIAAGVESGEASLAAARRSMQRAFAGLEGGDVLRVQDASGLSRGNKVSPRLMTAALEGAMRSERAGRRFLELFPRAGRSGTIARRMTTIRGRVRAKTGWIRGASSLSGVVLTSGDRVVVFSILMNYDPKRGGLNKRLKALQDRIVERVHEVL